MNDSPNTPINRLVGYCANCEEELCVSSQPYQDILLICPKDVKHLARVVKSPAGKLWLRIERWIRDWELRFGPMRWFGHWGGLFKARAGLFVVARLVAFILCVLILDVIPEGGLRSTLAIAFTLVGVFALLDIVISNTSAAFITCFPSNPIRSSWLTISAFLTIAAIFATFHIAMASRFTPRLRFVSALYFSMVTITTVGFGDVRPKDDAFVPQLVVIAELMTGLYFLVILFSIIASWATNPRRYSDPQPPDVVAAQTMPNKSLDASGGSASRS